MRVWPSFGDSTTPLAAAGLFLGEPIVVLGAEQQNHGTPDAARDALVRLLQAESRHRPPAAGQKTGSGR